jgi:DNA-binding response OmpR family regulator
VTTTLLAVDDSRTMRRVLEITFGGEGYKVVLANSGDDALNKLGSEHPTVALIDAQLGDTSGYDLCAAVKQRSPGTSVLILSSKQQPYDRGRGSSVGADDFMDKPFDTQQLIDKVGTLVRQAPQAAAPAAAPAPAAHAPAPAVPAAAAAASVDRARAQTLAFGTPSRVPFRAPPLRLPLQPSLAPQLQAQPTVSSPHSSRPWV